MPRRKTDPPRGILRTARADTNGYRHERYHASDDLDTWVEHFWLVEWDLGSGPAERVETLPHPSVHMVFETGQSRIRGPARAKFSTVLRGRGGVFAVKFRPAGFYSFLRTPVAALADRIAPIRDVFGSEADRLDHAVLGASGDEARIGVVEAFLRERRPKDDDNVPMLNAMIYAIAADRSILKVADLVERHAVTTRTLQRLFSRYVGVSPKWVIQRYRLHEAAEQLAANAAPRHADLALQLGYSDQAHFVRDFKAIVGVSPAAYARGTVR